MKTSKQMATGILLLVSAGAICTPAKARQADTQVKLALTQTRWQASWVTHPTASLKEFGVFHFRRTFELDKKPDTFIIHISADNRYRLFVNAEPACRGPARGDLQHWRYETVDIAPFLRAGKNCIAAVVWNFGRFSPWAQISLKTAFCLQTDDAKYSFINTDRNWRVLQDSAYAPVPVTLNTFVVVGPGEKIDGSKYPWGWQNTDYDDSAWPGVRVLEKASSRGNSLDNTWMLVPRTIPFMEEKTQRIPKIRRTQGIKLKDNPFDGRGKLAVEPNSKVSVLLDQTFLTTAYPQITVTGGKGAKIRLTYCEALFDKNMKKADRNQIEGRKAVGTSDVFLPDGGKGRLFSTLWFRTYRYIKMDIRTQNAPLTIDDFYGKFTAYPFRQNASFKSSDPSLTDIWNVGWRTARLCANETYFDCPYYEQLQYVGDTRIQTLISLYVAGDDTLMRKAITCFDDSRIPEGLTQSRYPSAKMQIIPPYSLFWVAMIHDYWMCRDDDEFVKSFLNGIDGVLLWHEKYIGPDGMLAATPWWNFVDWCWPWDPKKNTGGVPPLDKKGRSSILTLQLVYALNYAVELNRAFGRTRQADHYQKLAGTLKNATRKLCWDDKRRLLADTPDKKHFSQHANLLAVLVDLIPQKDRKIFVQRIAADQSLTQCTFYYRFYLFRAMKKAGLADEYVRMLGPWRDAIKKRLTTFPENPDPTRSDCHAWSASPNYDLLATVCGIEPAEPGFKTVRIAPHLGPLTWVEAKMLHPLGSIEVKLKRKEPDGITGTITLPAGLEGVFIFNGKTIHLKPGLQRIKL